jgi:hypothetical protein|tara:strand:+ start:515 stop:625 length:111 start_codon:yes stop_codon:yes gene_type:complete
VVVQPHKEQTVLVVEAVVVTKRDRDQKTVHRLVVRE